MMDDLFRTAEHRREREQRHELIDIREYLSRLHVEYSIGPVFMSHEDYLVRKSALERRLKELGG